MPQVRQVGLADESELQTGRVRKRQYRLLGHTVGPKCLSAVLGVGMNRLQKVLNGALDMRHSQFGGGVRQSPKTDSVDKFFFELHGTIAETLPTECFRAVAHFFYCPVISGQRVLKIIPEHSTSLLLSRIFI